MTNVRHTPAPIGAQQAHVRPGEWDMRQRGGAPLKGRTPPLSDAHSQPLSLGHNNRDAQRRT